MFLRALCRWYSVGKIYLFAVGQLTHNHLYKVSGMCIISTCVSTYFYKSKMFVFKIFCNDVEKKQKIIELYERFLKSCVSILIYSTTSYITSELRERSKYCTYIPACMKATLDWVLWTHPHCCDTTAQTIQSEYKICCYSTLLIHHAQVNIYYVCNGNLPVHFARAFTRIR